MKHLLQYVKSFFTPVWAKETTYVIVPAFKIGGVQYFEYSDYVNMPVERAMHMKHVYQEFDLKVDRQLLEIHTKTTEKLINEAIDALTIKEGTLNTAKSMRLLNKALMFNTDIEKRNEFISDPYLIYKLCSVVYFDKNEDPRVYDQSYGEKKIEFWMKHKMGDFFLNLPLQRLIPHIDFSKIDTETFTKINQAVAAITIDQIDRYLESNNSTGITTDLKNNLQQRRDQLQNLLQLDGLAYQNITNYLQRESTNPEKRSA